jgi:hypothetical protein
MSFDPHSHRFNPRWRSRGIETDWELSGEEAPDVSRFSSDAKLTSNVTDRELDEALRQVALERCCVCPLCGAIVGSDGSVLG